MAYRLTYTANVSWVGPGMGPMSGASAPALNGAPTAGAQTIDFTNKQGGQSTATFAAGDITTLLTAMTTDLSAQMNAAIAQVQGFASGGG